jgi:hypothetical protein
MTAGTRLSVLAVLSLVFGALGFTVIGSLFGILLGIIAKFCIGRSDGRLRGRGLATAGMILSAVWLLACVVAYGVVAPKIVRRAFIGDRGSYDNLRRLNQAVGLYRGDSGGKYPPAESWCTALRPNLGARADSVLRTAGTPPDQTYAYGYNAEVAGLTPAEVNPKTVLFFELETPAANAAGGAELLRHPGPPNELINVCLASGRITQVSSNEVATLRWKP